MPQVKASLAFSCPLSCSPFFNLVRGISGYSFAGYSSSSSRTHIFIPGGVKPDWLNAAVSRGFVLAIKSEPKKKPAWWCVLIIPELRRRRKEAILGYLVCSWPIEEAFKGEAWTVPKESRPGCPLASISGICTHMQLHKHAQHICTVSKRAVSTCACVLLWWAQVMNPAS